MITLIQHPSRKRAFSWALGLSLFAHSIGWLVVKYVPLLELAYSLRGIEFVDEDFDRRILVTCTQPLKSTPGYAGFRPPKRELSPQEIAKLEARRRAKQGEAERKEQEAKEAEAAAQRAAEAKAQQVAQANP